MVMSQLIEANPVNTKTLTILILINVIVACSINKANSDSQTQPLSVVYSKAFTDASINKVNYSENGQTILVASAFRKVFILDRSSFETTATFQFNGSLANARLIDNGNKIFIANQDGLVQIFDIESKKALFSHQFPHSEKLADTSAHANYIAYGGNVYSRSAGKLLSTSVSHAVQTALQIQCNSYVLSAGYRDQRVVVRNVDENTQKIWQTQDPITTASMMNNFIIAGTDNGDCYIWATPNNKPIQILNGAGRVTVIATHPQETIFAVARDKTVKIYSLKPFKSLLHIKLTSTIQTIAFSKSGIVGIGEDNGTIQVWNIKSASFIGRHKTENDAITTLAINPNKQDIVAGTYKGQLLLLSIEGSKD